MVISDPQKRNGKEYSLDAIHRLAARQKVVYGSPDVLRDTANFGYSLEEVCLCLQNLKEENYHESVHYDRGGWHDVYKCRWPAPNQPAIEIDHLYIKLKLNRDCITIVIASFHPEGTL